MDGSLTQPPKQYLLKYKRKHQKYAVRLYQLSPSNSLALLRELALLELLNSPHILALVELMHHEGNLYAVTEYTDGAQSLAQLLS